MNCLRHWQVNPANTALLVSLRMATAPGCLFCPEPLTPALSRDLWEGTLHGYVIRALSLVPDEVRSLGDLAAIHYLAFSQIAQWEGSPQGTLSRIQTEVVAARVSAINGCFY